MLIMNISNVVDFLSNKLNNTEIPASTLSPVLLKASSFCRPGLSAYKIAARIIENNKLLGIPTGPNPDGSENMINLYTYNVVKCICDALQNEAAVHISIPMETLMIQATGGNAGGPVTCVGTNIVDSISKGIIR